MQFRPSYTLTLALALGLFAPTVLPVRVLASAQCPQRIDFQNASFINHQEFPTSSQIKTNLNQSAREPGTRNPIWSAVDLQTAIDFVNALKANYNAQTHTLSLAPQWSEKDGQCTGKIGKFSYLYNPQSLEFDLSSPNNWPDYASMYLAPTHAEVDYTISFPSNCSGCSGRMELFEFAQTRVQE